MSLNGPAAARLYDEHVDAIYAYAARRVGPQAAVEVVEDVFEHALRQDAQRPAHTGTDLGWLLAMATAFLRRHSETECRRLRDWQPPTRPTSKAIPRVSDPLLAETAEDGGTITTARVMAAVADLDPLERDLLFLIAWEGCSSSLAAVATGVPQSEVRSRLSAIRKEIRRRVSAGAGQSSSSANPDAEHASTVEPDLAELAAPADSDPDDPVMSVDTAVPDGRDDPDRPAGDTNGTNDDNGDDDNDDDDDDNGDGADGAASDGGRS